MPKRRSADAPPKVKIERDQSKIAKKWWEKKQKVVVDLAPDKDKLLLETTQLSSDRDNLKQQINDLNNQISELQRQRCRLASEVDSLNMFNDSLVSDNTALMEDLMERDKGENNIDHVLSAVEPYGGFTKICESRNTAL